MGLTTVRSGNTTDSELIASFTTLTQYKIQNCIINLPYKSGGYTSVELRIAGVNLLDCRDNSSAIDGTSYGITYKTIRDSNNNVLEISAKGKTSQANVFRNLNYKQGVSRILSGKFATYGYSSQMLVLCTGPSGTQLPPGQTWQTLDASVWAVRQLTETYAAQASTWIRLQAQPYAKNVSIDTVVKPMWCLAAHSGCEFEPYTGNNYVVTLPTTIYGGTIDLAQGTVVGTYASDGSELSQNTTASFTPLKLFTKMGINNIWSYQGTVEISYDLVNMNHVSEARRKVIMSQPSLLQIEGQFITIQHAQFAPVAQCGAIITSTQTGSGTPSPNNIRPIVGLSEFNIIKCKKNLFDEIYTNIPINGDPVYKSIYVGDNIVTFSTTCGKNTNGYPVLYALSGKVTSGADSATNGFYNGLTRVVQPTNGYVTIGYRTSGEVDPRNYQTQIEIGSIATEYEPYLGTTTTINWPNSVNNVYVGTLDVLTGTLTITAKLLTLTGSESNATWNWNGYLVPVSDSVSDNSKVHVSACSHTSYLITGDAFFNSRQSQSQDTAVVCAASSGSQIRFRNRNAATDLTTMQTWLQGQYNAGTPVQIVYELNSPVTYQLTPPQLRTFRGVNNISADGTLIYISYWGHPQS